MDRKEYMKELMRKKRANKDANSELETANKTVKSVSKMVESVSTANKALYLSDLGVDLKELGVASCGPGLPILLVDMPTNDQIQGLCKVIHALNGDMEWEPRCGMGNSF